jgi:putative aminopeptidase FrvX
MDKKESLQRIRQLSEANGVSGFEDEVDVIVKGFTAGLGETKEDSLRNFYVYRKGEKGKPVVQLDAHLDELGFMVQCIKPNGTLKFISIGGWVNCCVPAHRVMVKTVTGSYIPGIIVSKPPHFMTAAERSTLPAIDDMSIDIGAASAEEAYKDFGIRIGAPVVPDAQFSYDEKHDIMVGKAFDCRIGCAAIIDVLKELKGKNLDVNLVGAFSSQEEIGSRGAAVTCSTVKPDIAIVFEGCPADDTVVESYASQTALHKGPMLRHIDAKMITNPRYQKFAMDTAEEKSITMQTSVRLGGSTNGAPIHLSNAGVPVIVIGIPVRYAHTHYGLSSYFDYENSVNLAVEIIKKLNKDVIASF